MAYTAGGLRLMSNHPPGFNIYRYDSLDAIATVDGDGYFNNDDDDLNLAVGDIIHVVDWDTAVGSGGTINDYGIFVVMQVGVSAAGAVDLSNDMLAGTLATGD